MPAKDQLSPVDDRSQASARFGFNRGIEDADGNVVSTRAGRLTVSSFVRANISRPAPATDWT
jgi:hypothetical protein